MFPVATSLPELNPDAVDATVHAEMDAQHLPGVAIAVVRGGDVAFAKGYGLASMELGAPVTPETVFCIGSLTKQFTAAAVLQQVEAGRLDLNMPIVRYVRRIADFAQAEFRRDWERITVRQLLSHTSGLKRDPVMFRPTENLLPPDYIPVLYAWARQDFTPSDLVAQMVALPLDFAPGEKMSYSNAGYTLLGMLVERVAGVAYPEYLRTRLFEPAGMSPATRLVEEDVLPGFATGYTWAGDGWRRGGYINPTRDQGAGSLVSTVLDLARWDAALYGDAVLTAASRAAMWTPAVLADGTRLPYGLGWALGERCDAAGFVHRWVGHGGMWGGFTAFLLRLPAEGLTVIVLTNLGISGRVPNGGQSGTPGMLAMKIAALLIPGIEWLVA
jgi:CubicO group peptidase (beta-lactamase class C family)